MFVAKEFPNKPPNLLMISLFKWLFLLVSLAEFFVLGKYTFLLTYFGLFFFFLSMSVKGAVVKYYGRRGFIKEGIFSYVRYPYYLATIFDVLGVALLLNALYSFFMGVVLFVPMLTYLANKEDVARSKRFKDYMKYVEETGMFFPFLETTDVKGFMFPLLLLILSSLSLSFSLNRGDAYFVSFSLSFFVFSLVYFVIFSSLFFSRRIFS